MFLSLPNSFPNIWRSESYGPAGLSCKNVVVMVGLFPNECQIYFFRLFFMNELICCSSESISFLKHVSEQKYHKLVVTKSTIMFEKVLGPGTLYQ